MSKKINLNFHVYPLVVGQEDKFIFSNTDKEGGWIQLEATLQDTDYTNDDIVWSSSDEKVAFVEAGKVQAYTTGIADVTATLPDGSSDVCRIQVIDNNGRLTALHVSLNTDRLVLNKGEGAALYPQILPVDYFDNGMLDKTFTWSSSERSVAVVNHRGRIWAKECGKAVITGVSNDVGREVSCEIEVIKKEKAELYIDPLEDVYGGTVEMKVQQEMQLQIPQTLRNESVYWRAEQPIYWTSENAGIVSVSKDGKATAFRPGNVRLWGTFINGGFRLCYDIKVAELPEHEVTEIHLNQYEAVIASGKQTKIYAVVYPAVLLEKQLQWKSSDESIVKITRQHINLSGLDEIIVEGVAEGSAVITGTLDGKEVSCSIEVMKEAVKAESIELPEEVELEPQQIMRLTPSVNKNTGEKYIWISDDRTSVTVDKDGTLKAYEDGYVSVYCVVVSSLIEEKMASLKVLMDIRSIQKEEKAEQLEELLSDAVYACCKVVVKAESDCLTNLHIPAETVTATSVCLLWNRKALIDTGDFAYYNVYDNGQLVAKTEQLSFRVKDLKPQSEHAFEVAAVNASGKEIIRKSVTAVTKAAPTAVLDVTKEPYNAVGNGIATDTYAIQRAIDDCPKGGVVLLPKGFVFYSGALFLKSYMTFQVDGILFGSQDPDDYPRIVCRWEGYRMLHQTEENLKATVQVLEENVYSHASLVNVGVYDEGEAGELSPYHTFDVCICGEGMINGNSFALAYNEGPCWYLYRKGLPIPQSPMTDQNVRGRAVAFYNTKGGYMCDVTVAYGPAWTVHPVFSDSMTFDNVKVISMGSGRTGTMEGMLTLNGDGIDPDSSTNINIIDSYFTVGDDAVAIKSGRNRQGNELAKPSAYIRVTDCVCKDAKGSFCIGSEQAGGVHDVLFQNLRMENLTNFGLWIKSAPCRGGLVEDVLMRDCQINKTGGALQIEYDHGGDENPALVLPETRRISYENITFEGTNKFGIRIMGHPDSPIYDVTFRGCQFAEDFIAKREGKFVLKDCHDIWFVDTELPSQYEWEHEFGK